MGAGSSLEAAWPLAGDLRAGDWHLAADCMVVEPVDVRLEILRRRGGVDTPIVMWEQSFEPGDDINRAQTHDLHATGPAVADVEDGDLLIFRYTGLTGTRPMAWIPNGDGARTMGRMPFLELP